MPSIPTVVAISFAIWLVVYIGWLVLSPGYREQQAAGWRRMGEPVVQNFITYSMFALMGVLWAIGADGDYGWSDLLPLLFGISGIVGLVVITRKRLRS